MDRSIVSCFTMIHFCDKNKKGHSARNRVPFFGVGVLKKKNPYRRHLFKDGSILDDGVAEIKPTRKNKLQQANFYSALVLQMPYLQFNIVTPIAIFSNVASDHDEIWRGFLQHFQRFSGAAGVSKLVALGMLHDVANQVLMFDSSE
ncbi:MAG: hypothetical protein ALAOOOJD_02743 [bacterium]|nr:hypothetical protein [bacterium]